MNQQLSIPTALCLPVPDIEALIQGRTIAALPKMFIRPGQRFALYPADYSVSIKAWANVPGSICPSSPPTGKPRAIRLTFIPFARKTSAI